ncbi:uncharacterized protein EURHEDRAFT_407848 [Aspergillus ruber CBS 135680]|uniref:A-kinase anchor protein 7-like phosphoesterase domain-containing protein n=1 Tax=Aspergillus ruber (strain CBS 135680) TaxID=1388766 RepID=A0A017SS92_ASPRC|nr:uncharacterized protein EURHEDRAFT_407848 [Aspergillus ruber CBS 135680]EYE99848.1 hypothetical protein EURHEDRAFT_407848 [Aspergillus ruber CBS 135680]
MSEQEKPKTNNKPRENFRPLQHKEKKSQLTHFLCLPLVNSISLPQLESSLATFRAAIPASPAQQKQGQYGSQQASIDQGRPLIPNSALRPVGTLHLTLGVMSLPSKERFEEALKFFQSLDLVAMMHEAGAKAERIRSRKGRTEQLLPPSLPESCDDGEFDTAQEATGPTTMASQTMPRPFNISLESLNALPRARSATVLHAAPVDPTSRLYPFCEMLRDKFLEAGFLQGEYKKPSQRQAEQTLERKVTEGAFRHNGGDKSEEGKVGNGNDSTTATDKPLCINDTTSSSLLEELPVTLAEEQSAVPQSQPPNPLIKPIHTPQNPELKSRPLLLHATVVNTIYIKGRQHKDDFKGKGGPKGKKNSRFTLDARGILDQYRNYYLDSYRTTPRSAAVTVSGNTPYGNEALPAEDINNLRGTSNAEELEDDPEQKKRKRSSSKSDGLRSDDEVKYPFVWAKDFPLESVCICEMGAKKLNPDEGGLNARLGEEYKVVAERSLSWDPSVQPATEVMVGSEVMIDGNISDGSSDGGVRVTN